MAEDWRRLLDHLAAAGPSLLEDIQVELSLKPKELKSIRSPLERCGAVVSRNATLEEGEATELARWDQVYPDARDEGLHLHHFLENLVVAGVHAAVVAPERELQRWFSWPWYWTDTFIDDLVRDGRLRRVDGHVTST